MDLTGGALTIRDAQDHVSLRASFETSGVVAIERVDMFLGGDRLIGSPTELELNAPGGGRISLTGEHVDGCAVGIALN